MAGMGSLWQYGLAFHLLHPGPSSFFTLLDHGTTIPTTLRSLDRSTVLDHFSKFLYLFFDLRFCDSQIFYFPVKLFGHWPIATVGLHVGQLDVDHSPFIIRW